MKIRHWSYLRVPLDDRDRIIELDFADTSALGDVDAFECRRQNEKDRAREREEIERSRDVPGDISMKTVNARSPNRPLWGGHQQFQRALRCMPMGRAFRLPHSRAFSKPANRTQHLHQCRLWLRAFQGM